MSPELLFDPDVMLESDEIVVSEAALSGLVEKLDHLIHRAQFYGEHQRAEKIFTDLRDRTKHVLRSGRQR